MQNANIEQQFSTFVTQTTALPLLFVFSSEVFNSGIKSCFGGVVSQVAVYEECFI